MNSAEDISKYDNHNNNYYWPIAGSDTANHSYSHKSPKKDKKWSLGSIFRRKKKNDTDSTSEDDHKKKKKSNRRQTKTNKPVGFDHIVRQTNFTNDYNRRGIFSEPDCQTTHNFIPASEITRPSRKCKRDGIKARAEARIRDNSRGEGSSEEDSPFKSDESSTSSSRRTRTARTLRYLRRHSKDDENHLTKSDELWQPYINFSGLSTIPPGYRSAASNKASSFCNYDIKDRLSVSNNQRSISYDGNIHHRTTSSTEPIIIHGHLPLGFPANMLHRIKAPPPPPPRDPNRMVNFQNAEIRPMSFSFDHKTNSDQHLHRFNHRISTNRSTSEDQLSVLPHGNALVARPSSTSPKLNEYRYLTDKNPRSRKPICVIQPSSFNFWRRKEDVKPKSPVMFTAKTHVTTSIFSQPENNTQNMRQSKATDLHNHFESKTEPKRQPSPLRTIEIEPRKSANLEEALDELEAIYKSLQLGDEELLDRAAERESPSDPTLKPKLKMEPDLKSDDMAYRKFCKERNNSGSDCVSPGSYLLSSPVFGGSSNEFYKNNSSKEPDVTFDDVVYRNVRHTNNALKIPEPQPPFGIPVGPVLPSANSDYLHAAPVNYKKSKKVPDIVKDDLAYRNLRKDSNKEPALPQASREDYLSNHNYKKKRAVRSLSANIFNLMHQNQKLQVFDNSEPGQDIDDVADALQIARQILKDKEDKINATRKAFLSDGEIRSNKYGSPKACHRKLQEGRLDAKPPRSPKSSTPVPSNSHDEDAELEKALQHSTLEELLTSLARETSEHITHGLKTYDASCDLLGTPDISGSCKEATPTDTKSMVVETVQSIVLAPEVSEEEHDYVNIQSDCETELIGRELDDLQKKLDGADLNDIEVLENIDKVDNGKIGGEECVNVQYIALPTNGCTYINKSSFKFDNLSYNTAEDLINDNVFNELTSSLTQLVKTSMDIKVNSMDEVVTNTLYCDSFLNEQNIFPMESFTLSETEKPFNVEYTNETNSESQSLINNSNNPVEFELGFIHSEQREISQISDDFDSLKSPKLVQNLNSCCTTKNPQKPNEQSNSSLAITNNSWYDDPSVIAVACSCGIACSYQLPFDIIAALGLLFAVISMLIAIITRI